MGWLVRASMTTKATAATTATTKAARVGVRVQPCSPPRMSA